MLSRVSAYASRHFSKARYAAAQWHHVHTEEATCIRVCAAGEPALQRAHTRAHTYTRTQTCARRSVYPPCAGCETEHNRTEQNRTERSRAERNRMKRNRSERSREAQADCTAAACLLAHLGVLNLYVVSSTGSAISLSHWRDGRRREESAQPRKGREGREQRGKDPVPTTAREKDAPTVHVNSEK
ncbi:uncharacterized protein LOC143153883 [Ptiloglossa arizonensis]|uniref:uncharacterized protein LOC143153883 n=1 Tax=Ptiloglossa arizonensis TaxID=3350558 RepID=UPI003F9F008D